MLILYMNHIITYITHSLQSFYTSRELQSLTLIICKDMLEINDMDIYLRKDIKLSENKQHLLERTVERLKNSEPIQYVTGKADFYGLRFRVEPGVLIPRPETEELVDLILKENPVAVRILDIGTGSGCIALALGHHLPEARVDAWDISEKALRIAHSNADDLKINVNFSLVDVLSVDPVKNQYDVIVSNPPYITEKEKAVMEKNVLEWEPDLALFVSDADPLLFYRRIAELGREMLVADGKLYFEINQQYGEETVDLLNSLGYKNIRLIKDLFENNRIVTANR